MSCKENVLMLMKRAMNQLVSRHAAERKAISRRSVCSRIRLWSHQATAGKSGRNKGAKAERRMLVSMEIATASNATNTGGANFAASGSRTPFRCGSPLDPAFEGWPANALAHAATAPAAVTALFTHVFQVNAYLGRINTRQHAPSHKMPNRRICAEDRDIHSRSSSCSTWLERPT